MEFYAVRFRENVCAGAARYADNQSQHIKFTTLSEGTIFLDENSGSGTEAVTDKIMVKLNTDNTEATPLTIATAQQIT